MTATSIDTMPADSVLGRYERSKSRRSAWESHWRECYDYAMPQRDGTLSEAVPGQKKTDKLFDGTAPDAVDQLAASLMAELTPPWTRWFDLVPGSDVSSQEAMRLAGPLEEASATLQRHFDRSNFAVEIHQCYLDLVTVGTASLLFEEAALGESTAFHFTAVPLGEAVLDEGPTGMLDISYRLSEFTEDALKARFPKAEVVIDHAVGETDQGEKKYAVLEAVIPDQSRGYAYRALLTEGSQTADHAIDLAQGTFPASPFINFRWMKAPGEIYGRSPVMKALPDIKTANKVVELVLKNATIAVTGIWQADDDGVLNPATVKLLPGTIIPKAVGSSGLTPLSAPGNFDVSTLMLQDMRSRIRSSLLVDKFGQVNTPRMTATEVLERSAETARQLGATYGRLQAELLFPLVRRAVSILRRRGEIPDIAIDGHEVDLQIVSPIALHRRQAEAQSALQWFQMIGMFGPEAAQIVKPQEAARWFAKSFRIPDTLLRTPEEITAAQSQGPKGQDMAGIDPMAGLGGLLGGLTGEAGAADPLAALSSLAGAEQSTVDPNAAISASMPAMSGSAQSGPAQKGGGNV
ncbi:MAG: portal protein [Alphaproteobacteria bacterium]|nr:portal protein [Alphaproteobacteria bacterium]